MPGTVLPLPVAWLVGALCGAGFSLVSSRARPRPWPAGLLVLVALLTAIIPIIVDSDALLPQPGQSVSVVGVLGLGGWAAAVIAGLLSAVPLAAAWREGAARSMLITLAVIFVLVAALACWPQTLLGGVFTPGRAALGAASFFLAVLAAYVSLMLWSGEVKRRLRSGARVPGPES